MLTKEQKIKFVEEHTKLLDKYSVVGIVPLSNIPDRLLQKSKNQMRSDVKFILGRRTLLTKILESKKELKPLIQEMSATSAIILSNGDPFEIYNNFKANTLKLAAKPNQIASDDIEIKSGETSIQPGQAVTELKQAGIDVKIDKGKVVISKDKVLVAKGAVIATNVAKALRTLGVMPFTAYILPSVITDKKLMFKREVLSIDAASSLQDLMQGFNKALALSLSSKIINKYTISHFISEAYTQAEYLGITSKVYDTGIADKLIANAASHAAALDGAVQK